MKPLDIPTFATTQLTLLDYELQSELEETHLLTSTHSPSILQRAGLAILNLTYSGQRTGLGGKTLIDLTLDPAIGGGSGELPSHGLRVGDICAIAEQPKGVERRKEREGMENRGVEGVVTKVQKDAVTVALDREEVEVPGGKLWLVKLVNDVTHKRLHQTMTRLQKMPSEEYSQLTHVLFGQASPTPISEKALQAEIEWHDPTLNESQKDAIRFALASKEIALIHGPPGTGKTHTLIELILQLLPKHTRLLVCGPSNLSVDNIVERLSPHRIPLLRLGHPARLLPAVLSHSLDVLTKSSDAAALVSDIRGEIDDKLAAVRKTRNGAERREVRAEVKELRRELRQREGRVVGDLVRGCRVVLCTLHGAGGFHLKGEKFDVVIVDEASQALEAQCWIPILGCGAEKVVLAGDHLQLPPTIKSVNLKDGDGKKIKTAGEKEVQESEEMTLETTLFDRLLALHGDGIKRMLTTQYRMHEAIMAFPSRALYDGQLIAAEAVKSRLLTSLPYEVQPTDDTSAPLVFWDTQGGDFPEDSQPSLSSDENGEEKQKKERMKANMSLLAESKSNALEAALVRRHVSRLIAAGVREEDIAVITPYNGQVSLLVGLLKGKFPAMEVGSVDGFQGREKEAVVVSLVR
ncbi:MAG: hypothetical protein FE78DRAFT_190990, partial [Acidomyces sp. 'richmondensis']